MPIVWERLPELIHQERADWWRYPALAQRLIADVAALAIADGMFVFAADEAIGCAMAAGQLGDDAVDALARSPESASGSELVACMREASGHAVIPALPPPAALRRSLSGDELEPAEDAFTDLASAYLEAGADAVAVNGGDAVEVADGVRRAAALGKLYGRPVLGLCQTGETTSGWTEHGAALGVVSETGGWPANDSGVVITPGDVSSRWDAARLRAVGSARP